MENNKEKKFRSQPVNKGLSYEEATKFRLNYLRRLINVLDNFIEKGFHTFSAFHAIIEAYFPGEIDKTNLASLWHVRFGNIKNRIAYIEIIEEAYDLINESMLAKIEKTVEILDHE